MKELQASHKKGIWLTILFVVALGLVGAGVYYWQNPQLQNANRELNEANDKVLQLNKQLSRANSEIKNTNSALDSLQKQYNEAQVVINNYKSGQNTKITTQTDLDVEVNGAQYVNPAGTVTQEGKWFGVNITLTNNTSSSVGVSSSNFRLKDSENNEYKEQTIQNASTLPAGWVSMPASTILAPGQSLKGTIEFNMSGNDSIKKFTFINLTRPYSIISLN